MKASDLEVLRIMRDGGKLLCQHAQHKWTSGAYETSREMQNEERQRWRDIEKRISEIFKIAKDAINDI